MLRRTKYHSIDKNLTSGEFEGKFRVLGHKKQPKLSNLRLYMLELHKKKRLPFTKATSSFLPLYHHHHQLKLHVKVKGTRYEGKINST